MQVGWIYVDFDDIVKEFGELTEETKERAKTILEQEVRIYDQYLTGDIYSYTVSKSIKCDSCKNTKEEIEDSCTGYFGSDFETNGLYDHAGKEWFEVKEIEG